MELNHYGLKVHRFLCGLKVLVRRLNYGLKWEKVSLRDDYSIDKSTKSLGLKSIALTTGLDSKREDPFSLKGNIYFLKSGTSFLPDFGRLTPVGSIYTKELNIPKRSFDKGFPGVTERFEWFAIDYSGTFMIDRSGNYRFRLTSDDGAKLFIDNELVIDNDGLHPPEAKESTVYIGQGLHQIRVPYFQGPRTMVALVLEVAKEGESYRLFSLREMAPQKGMTGKVEGTSRKTKPCNISGEAKTGQIFAWDVNRANCSVSSPYPISKEDSTAECQATIWNKGNSSITTQFCFATGKCEKHTISPDKSRLYWAKGNWCPVTWKLIDDIDGKVYTDSRGTQVRLSLGDFSFADEVVHFEEGTPSARYKKDSRPEDALGAPDHVGEASIGDVTLGCGGVLALKFVDNVLIDIDGPDLYVFEVGPAVEPTVVAISKDGQEWIELGEISGGEASIDISPFVKPGDEFRYVGLIDLKTHCDGDYPGADIDAVERWAQF